MFFLLFLTAVEAAAQESQTITLADNGKTIILKANETFLLKLGEGYEWDITLDDQTIFSRVVNVLVVRGAQGIYVAQRPGNATLTAVGSPECLKSQPPCARPSILFKLFVVVPGQGQVPETFGFEVLMVISAVLAAILIIRRRKVWCSHSSSVKEFNLLDLCIYSNGFLFSMFSLNQEHG